jgi:hypothetical protein
MEYLRTGNGEVDISELRSVEEVSSLALKRWIIPRADRRPDYREWKREELIALFGRHSRQMAGKVLRVGEFPVSDEQAK